MRRPRTSWTVNNLADWLANYDTIHKSGTMREPYNYETWRLIVQDVALDYADSLKEEEEAPKDIDKEIVDTLLKKLEEPF